METPEYSYDLPAGYRSWVEFDADIEQHIARPHQVQDVYWYLSRENVNVITMGELPDHQQLRYERKYVARMARQEGKPRQFRVEGPTPSTDLPPGIRTWTELLASFDHRFMKEGWVDAYVSDPNDPARFTHYYQRHQIMQHVAEERKASEVEPFTVDELHSLRYMIQDYGRMAPTGALDSVEGKVLRLLTNAREAERIKNWYPQQVIRFK